MWPTPLVAWLAVVAIYLIYTGCHAPPFGRLSDRLKYTLIQPLMKYCTGWLLLALAGLLAKPTAK